MSSLMNNDVSGLCHVISIYRTKMKWMSLSQFGIYLITPIYFSRLDHSYQHSHYFRLHPAGWLQDLGEHKKKFRYGRKKEGKMNPYKIAPHLSPLLPIRIYLVEDS
jgi:hypothetical protein